MAKPWLQHNENQILARPVQPASVDPESIPGMEAPLCIGSVEHRRYVRAHLGPSLVERALDRREEFVPFVPCERPLLFTAAFVESEGAEAVARLLDEIYYGQVDADRLRAFKRALR